jgi:hypothetical protein
MNKDPRIGWACLRGAAIVKHGKMKALYERHYTLTDLGETAKKGAGMEDRIREALALNADTPYRPMFGQVVLQIMSRKGGKRVFVDATSYISAVSTLPSLSSAESVVAKAKALHSFFTQGSQEQNASEIIGFPESFYTLLVMSMSVNEFYSAEIASSCAPGPVYLRPYFDIEYVFDDPDGCEIEWNDCEVMESKSPKTTTIMLPEYIKDTIKEVCATLDDVIQRAFPQFFGGGIPELPDDDIIPEHWSLFLGSRCNKFSAHVIWNGRGICESMAAVASEAACIAQEGIFAARWIDPAVYRMHEGSSSSLRMPLCANRHLTIDGLLYPVNKDGTVSFPTKGRCGFNEMKKRIVDVSKKAFITCHDKTTSWLRSETLIPESMWKSFKDVYDTSRDTKCKNHVVVRRGASVKDVFGKKGICREVPLDDMVESRADRIVSDSGLKLIRFYVRNGPKKTHRICASKFKHSGKQRYCVIISENGVIMYKCFRGSKNYSCAKKSVFCVPFPISKNDVKELFRIFWK